MTRLYYIKWLKWLKAFILKGLNGVGNNTGLFKDNTIGVKNMGVLGG